MTGNHRNFNPLGAFIRDCIAREERKASEQRIQFLKSLPANTFRAIYEDCMDVWAGTTYNGVYFSEWEVYTVSLERDEGYEILL